MYFSGHNRFQSLSQIFIRVAYPIQPFGFKFVANRPPPFLPDDIRNGSGKEPDLFEQLDDSETDEF
jgi:hypothetical protein